MADLCILPQTCLPHQLVSEEGREARGVATVVIVFPLVFQEKPQSCFLLTYRGSSAASETPLVCPSTHHPLCTPVCVHRCCDANLQYMVMFKYRGDIHKNYIWIRDRYATNEKSGGRY